MHLSEKERMALISQAIAGLTASEEYSFEELLQEVQRTAPVEGNVNLQDILTVVENLFDQGRLTVEKNRKIRGLRVPVGGQRKAGRRGNMITSGETNRVAGGSSVIHGGENNHVGRPNYGYATAYLPYGKIRTGPWTTRTGPR